MKIIVIVTLGLTNLLGVAAGGFEQQGTETYGSAHGHMEYSTWISLCMHMSGVKVDLKWRMLPILHAQYLRRHTFGRAAPFGLSPYHVDFPLIIFGAAAAAIRTPQYHSPCALTTQ